MLQSVMRLLSEKIFRKLLQLYFGFDEWHISPLTERPYAVDIVAYCNKFKARDFLAEIGCGLGDIIRNVHFSDRTGYDMEEEVLRAARMLPVKGSRKSLRFCKFRFPEDRLTGKFNVILLVNWIHVINPSILKENLAKYFRENLLDTGAIIIDTVQDPQYLFNHNIAYLTDGFTCSLERLGNYARQREVWVIMKKN